MEQHLAPESLCCKVLYVHSAKICAIHHGIIWKTTRKNQGDPGYTCAGTGRDCSRPMSGLPDAQTGMKLSINESPES